MKELPSALKILYSQLIKNSIFLKMYYLNLQPIYSISRRQPQPLNATEP